jgi:hypothetical protein
VHAQTARRIVPALTHRPHARKNRESACSRFAQKSGFGGRRRDATASRVKIFSLPKFATQSPRMALSAEAAQQQSGIGNLVR